MIKVSYHHHLEGRSRKIWPRAAVAAHECGDSSPLNGQISGYIEAKAGDEESIL
jgi:hypothetical protein